MTAARRTSAVVLLALVAGPASAQDAVKYPPRPDTVAVQLRYRIRADRAERVRQFEQMTANLRRAGFVRDFSPEAETDPVDPLAERMTGTAPSKSVFRLLDDPRVRTILFQPTDFNLPADQSQPVSVRIGLPAGLRPTEEQRLHRQVVAQLGRLGFREAVGYDTRGYSWVRGDLPAGNVPRLLKDLRLEPAGWFAADSPADELPPPLRDVLPVRWVEILPDPPLTPLAPAAVPPNRVKLTPGLRGLLDAAGGKPVRVEVVYDHRPEVAELDALRARLRTGYSTAARVATLEGAAGNVVTVDFPGAAGVEAFANEPGVVYLRRPVRGAETVAAGAEGVDPAKLLSATRLDAFHARGYRGKGTKVVVIGTDFPGLRSWWGLRFLGDFRTPVTLIDLTAEFDPALRPAPGGASHSGTAAARAAHLAAPDARLVLVRVDPAALFQVDSVARFATGTEAYTEAMQSRLGEIAARGEELERRRVAAIVERARSLEDPSGEPAAVDRRTRAREALEAIQAEEAEQAATVARALALQASMRSLAGATVVVNTLAWEDGYSQDGLSDLSQLLDASFASDAVTGPRVRVATAPRPPGKPVWVQATSPLAGSVWAGPFLDPNADGAMEFAPPGAKLPAGEWTQRLNFLGVLGADGKATPDLPAGTRVRLVVQWRETHDPYGFGGAESVFPLTLRVFRQLDPEGKTRASDEVTEVARSVGGPYRLWAEPAYGVYEQVLEFTAAEAGRYAVGIDGVEVYDPRIPALRKRIEITPRLIAEFDGAGADKGRPVWRSYRTPTAGVGIPGDSRVAITVSASAAPFGDAPAGLTGAGPGVVLLPKPDLVANGAVGGIAGAGSGVAAGFAGGVAAALIGSGAPPGELLPATGLRRGGPAVIPEGWLNVVPRK